MEYFNLVDIILLISLAAILTILGFLYRTAFLKHAKAMAKVDLSIQKQEQANHHLALILNELRRSNQYLADLAGLEGVEGIESVPQEEALSHTKLYIGNIDYSATEAELASHFARYGKVEFVNIPVNRYTGKARGFGFITFSSPQDAENAMELNGSEFKGRQIQVNFAKERETA